jgi:hypothetical protein
MLSEIHFFYSRGFLVLESPEVALQLRCFRDIFIFVEAQDAGPQYRKELGAFSEKSTIKFMAPFASTSLVPIARLGFSAWMD